MKNCFIQTLKESVGNFEGQKLTGNKISVKLQYSPTVSGTRYFRVKKNNKPITFGNFDNGIDFSIKSDIYQESELIATITDNNEVTIEGRDYRDLYIGKVLNQSYLTIINLDAVRELGSGYIDSNKMVPFYIDVYETMKCSALIELNLTLFRDPDIVIILEDYFEKLIEAFKRTNRVQNPSYLHTIVVWDEAAILNRYIKFNNADFYKGILAMDGDYQSTVYTFYSSRSSDSVGYVYSDPVATFNYTTKEWTYL